MSALESPANLSQGSTSPMTTSMSPFRYSLKSDTKYSSIFNESPPANFGFATPHVGRQRRSLFDEDTAFVPLTATYSNMSNRSRSPVHSVPRSKSPIFRASSSPSSSRAPDTDDNAITQDKKKTASPQESSRMARNDDGDLAWRDERPYSRHRDKEYEHKNKEPQQQIDDEEQAVVSPRPSYSATSRFSYRDSSPEQRSQKEPTELKDTAMEVTEIEENTTSTNMARGTYIPASRHRHEVSKESSTRYKDSLKMKSSTNTTNSHPHRHQHQHHPYRGQFPMSKTSNRPDTKLGPSTTNTSRTRISDYDRERQPSHTRLSDESRTIKPFPKDVPAKEERAPLVEQNRQRQSTPVTQRNHSHHFMEHTVSSQSRYRSLRQGSPAGTISPKLGPRKAGGITKRVATSRVPPFRSTTRINAIEDIHNEMVPGEVFISMAQRIKLFEKDLGNGVVPKDITPHRPARSTRPRSPVLLTTQRSFNSSSRLSGHQATNERNMQGYMRNRRYD